MNITAADIGQMDYNELIGLVRETNRPPGGLRSISAVARHAHLSAASTVLDVGTSTGITAVELARIVGCRVTAIDINAHSLAEGRRRAQQAGVENLISFEQRDVLDSGLPEDAFDLVFCGNVTSLLGDKERGLAEYTRLTKSGGFLGAIPMYYVDSPSGDLIARVSAAIDVPIEPLYRDFWLDFFTSPQRNLFLAQDYRFDHIADDVVDDFVDQILSRPHLAELDSGAVAALESRYREFMHLFQENLACMGFTVMLLRKEATGAEPELFTATRVG
jgi:SAM-dependent methyltransferase